MKFEPTKLPMTNEEIRREYLEAKDRPKQIWILADENLCSVSRIEDILRSEGVFGCEPLPEDPGEFYNKEIVQILKKEHEEQEAMLNTLHYPYEEGDGGDTDATLHVKEEPQTRVDETIGQAVTLDAVKKLERVGGEFKKFIDTRLNMTVCTLELNEDAALAVAAMIAYCLKRCDAKMEQINASLEEIARRRRDQELVRDTLLSIKERLPKFEKFNFEKSNLFDEEGK